MEKIGIQLYSIQEMVREDLVRALGLMAGIGFQGVEFAGFFGNPAKLVREALDGEGLVAAGSHVHYAELSRDFSRVVDYSEEIGATRIVCTHMPQELRKDAEGWKRQVEMLNEVARSCAARGLVCGYQNHDFEFRASGDRKPMDILLAECSREGFFLELEAFWVEYAGESSVEWLGKWAGRASSIHVKDMKRRGEVANVEVGSGVIDYGPIVAAAEKAGTDWFFVKQENYDMPVLDSLRRSFLFLRGIL
jgi:sugar phosphate isomerase/epimerase